MTEVTKFEENQMMYLASYASLDRAVTQLKKQQDEIKAELLKAMEDHNIKSIDNDILKITLVAASESTSVDLKEFAKQEPVDYAQLLEDYPKITKRSSSLRIKVKEEK